MYDEPFSDSSQIPTYLVSKLARQAVTVALSGDGGDEIFGGYSRYTLIGSIWKYGKAIPRPIKIAAARMLQWIPPQRIDQGFSLARPFLPKALRLTTPGDKAQKLVPFLTRKSPQDLYYQALSHWDNPEEVVIGGCEPSTVRECIAEFSNGASNEEAMMLTDLVNYLPDDILTKLDRASMAASLEARVPLLDHRVVEFAWTLPPSQRKRKGVSKWILRQILYKYIPPELIERPKMGFGVPIGRWLRGPLKEWAESLLDGDRLRREGYFDLAPIRQTWEEHMAGRGAWQYHLWDILMFQAWLEENQRRPRAFDVAPAAKCASGL
jgi:asparagine synthase (glutamine-hydrolysing)